MSISAIVAMPLVGQYMTAYNPIVLQVAADVPVAPDLPMFCDVYFSDTPTGTFVFYKTISSYTITNTPNGLYTFDIQDAAQEYIKTYMPTLFPLTPVQNATGGGQTLVACKCRFRSASLIGGLLVTAGVPPVQGTATSSPRPGDGVASNVFYVLNAALKPLDAKPLSEHFSYIKYDPSSSLPNAFPLSNLPKTLSGSTRLENCPEVYATDFGQFPFLIQSFATGPRVGPESRNCRLNLHLFGWNGALLDIVAVTDVFTLGRSVYYMPVGQKDLGLGAPYFANINTYASYRMQLLDWDLMQTILFSPMYKIARTNVETMRVWFQNAFGMFEQLTFVRSSEEFKTTSSEYFRSYDIVNLELDPGRGRRRYNVRSSETLTGKAVLSEGLMPWAKELFASPRAFVQIVDGEHAMSEYTYCLYPIVIQDVTVQTRKSLPEQRFSYEVTMKFTRSYDYINIRN